MSETNRLSVAPNGPMILKGQIDLVDGDGNVVRQETQVALCRCGASANKPFCDGQHKACDFEDDGSVGVAKAIPPKGDGRRVAVKLAANGPVMLEGPFEVADGSGEVRLETGRAALCRCGASANKPFCDGQHKACGFEAGADLA